MDIKPSVKRTTWDNLWAAITTKQNLHTTWYLLWNSSLSELTALSDEPMFQTISTQKFLLFVNMFIVSQSFFPGFDLFKCHFLKSKFPLHLASFLSQLKVFSTEVNWSYLQPEVQIFQYSSQLWFQLIKVLFDTLDHAKFPGRQTLFLFYFESIWPKENSKRISLENHL